MGNIGSSSGSARRERRRRGSGHQNNNPDSSHPPAHPQFAASSSPSSAAISGNRYVFASPPATTTTTTSAYPTAHYPNPHGPLYYQYPGHQQLPAPLDHHHHHHHHWVGGYMAAPPPPPPQHQEGFSLVKRQKAVTIRNDVNLKKETLRMEPDELNPGCFLVAFTFDATVTGRISIFFFAREGADCSLTPAHASVGRPFTATFKEGIGQKFRQPTGSGISSAMLEEAERSLLQRDGEVYALAVKAEGSSPSGGGNSLITQAALEKKEKGGRGWEARVVKQVLWVDGTRYELQEIYGIGNSVESEFDGNDPGKECVICLSEPRDTTVLPCRHMCMCSECAKVLGLQTNRCPICRQPIERLLEIKVNGGGDSPPPADEKP